MNSLSKIALILSLPLSLSAVGCGVQMDPSDDAATGTTTAALTRNGSVVLDRQIRLANNFCLQDRGSTVTQEVCTAASAAQLWRTIGNANGTVTLRATASGRCLDVPGWSSVDGADLQTFACNGGTNQQFRLSAPSWNGRTIQPSYNAMCLDIEWGTAAGQKLQQFGVCHANSNQRFYLPPRLVGTTIERCSDVKTLDIDVATQPRIVLGERKNFDIDLSSNGVFHWWCYDAATERRSQVGRDRTSCPSGTSIAELYRWPAGSGRRIDVLCYE